DDVLAGLRGGDGGGAVQVVGQAEHDHVEVGKFVHLAVIGEPARDVVLLGEGLDVLLGGRADGDDLAVGYRAQGLEVDGRDELAADEADTDGFHGSLGKKFCEGRTFTKHFRQGE